MHNICFRTAQGRVGWGALINSRCGTCHSSTTHFCIIYSLTKAEEEEDLSLLTQCIQLPQKLLSKPPLQKPPHSRLDRSMLFYPVFRSWPTTVSLLLEWEVCPLFPIPTSPSPDFISPCSFLFYSDSSIPTPLDLASDLPPVLWSFCFGPMKYSVCSVENWTGQFCAVDLVTVLIPARTQGLERLS